MKYAVRIRTKNFSAQPLRKQIFTPVRTIFRLGSVTETKEVFPKSFGVRQIFEINTANAVRISSSKLRMKLAFHDLGVKQAEAYTFDPANYIFSSIYNDTKRTKVIEMKYPIIAKKIYGFKARGMELLSHANDFTEFTKSTRREYFYEKFYNYSREYRIHVSTEGYFLAWRKLRKSEAETRWYFNDSNCNWIGEDHKLFDRPKCWDKMIYHSQLSLKAVGLDIGAVDIRVQSNKSDNPDFIVCEINSAPALGNVGLQKYEEELKKLINLRS